MAVGTDNKAVLATSVVVAGLFIGINNTLITETVMKAAPVERGVASAAYSFVRFSGAAVAPWLAGVLGGQISVHLPFWVGAAAVRWPPVSLSRRVDIWSASTSTSPNSTRSPSSPLRSPSIRTAETS
jgi:MFS family permease